MFLCVVFVTPILKLIIFLCLSTKLEKSLFVCILVTKKKEIGFVEREERDRKRKLENECFWLFSKFVLFCW